MKSLKLRQFFKSTMGFSLTELMVTLAISGLGGIALLNLSNQQSKNEATQRKHSQINQLTNLAGILLSKRESCRTSLSGVNITTSALHVLGTENVFGAPVTSLTKQTPSGSLDILRSGEQYGFTAVKSASGTTYAGTGEQTVRLDMFLNASVDRQPSASADPSNLATASGMRRSREIRGHVILMFQTAGGGKSNAVYQARRIPMYGYIDGTGQIVDCVADFENGSELAKQRFCLEFVSGFADGQSNPTETDHDGTNLLGSNRSLSNSFENYYEDGAGNPLSGAALTTRVQDCVSNLDGFEDTFAEALERRVCENMGGSFSSGNCEIDYERDFSCSGATPFLRGFQADGTPICDGNMEVTRMACNPEIQNCGGPTSDPTCDYPGSWSGGNCSDGSGGGTLLAGGSITLTDNNPGDGYTGNITYSCDGNGNLTNSSRSCNRVATQCAEVANFSWGTNCAATIPSKREGEVATVDNTVRGFMGTVERRCNADGTWSTLSQTCEQEPDWQYIEQRYSARFTDYMFSWNFAVESAWNHQPVSQAQYRDFMFSRTSFNGSVHLRRCLYNGRHHYLSRNADCNKAGHPYPNRISIEQYMGYISKNKTNEYTVPLITCMKPNVDQMYTTTTCPAGFGTYGTLGWMPPASGRAPAGGGGSTGGGSTGGGSTGGGGSRGGGGGSRLLD